MLPGMNVATPHGTLTLRPETESDAAFAFHLFASTKAEETALMPLDDPGKAFLLRMQFRSMTETYRREFPNARFEIVELDRTPIGRLVTDVQADCVYYVDIAVLPERQGGGIATALMTAALEEPRRLGLPGRVKGPVDQHRVAAAVPAAWHDPARRHAALCRAGMARTAEAIPQITHCFRLGNKYPD